MCLHWCFFLKMSWNWVTSHLLYSFILWKQLLCLTYQDNVLNIAFFCQKRGFFPLPLLQRADHISDGFKPSSVCFCCSVHTLVFIVSVRLIMNLWRSPSVKLHSHNFEDFNFSGIAVFSAAQWKTSFDQSAAL